MPSGVYKRQSIISINPKTGRDNLGRFIKEHIQLPNAGFQKGHISCWKGKHPGNYKGGRKKSSEGYVLIFQPSHQRANKDGYIKRCYLVMEKIIGRHIRKGEIIHHKGTKYPMNSLENKGDDRPTNLKLFANNGEHMKFHHPKGSLWGKNKI